MQVHSLELANEYKLIGIHTSVEDYKLAYLINQNLNAGFSKYKEYLDFSKKNGSFSVFEFIDDKNQLINHLISNKYIGSVSQVSETNLFSEEGSYSTMSYLIPEKKKVDFFLKVEGEISHIEFNKTIDKLNHIDQIITTYSINPSQLKSKDFLIF
jgi:hypothetical protein|tara:strand:- start:204 stop:668 length:465 start_codon:yes stop_codon:yes gene_type:complete